MEGPEDFLIRFGREVIAEMAVLDREHQHKNLTPHGRDLREWLHRVADRVAAPTRANPKVNDDG